MRQYLIRRYLVPVVLVGLAVGGPAPARGERGGQAIEGGRPADLGVERVVIGDVVAVRAAGAAAEARGEVGVAHPERVEVGTERGHRVEAERAPQLQAIRRVTLSA
jgi:hypothetical protein